MNENMIVKKISFIGIGGNILLCAFKLFAGIFGHSGAMISDAVHSLSDVFATFIAFLGVRLSSREADKKHPYGHERLECVASIILAVILCVTGVGIGMTGLRTILAGDYHTLEIPGRIALIAAAVSIAAKEGMFQYTMHYAKILHSSAFAADAWHHRSDALSSVGSFIGIAGALMGFPILDSVASVGISLCILKVAADILKDAIDKMLDSSCCEETEKELYDFIAEQEGVERIDLLMTRKFGNKIYLDTEIAVEKHQSLIQAHDIAESVHAAVEARFPDVKHIMIHVNPA